MFTALKGSQFYLYLLLLQLVLCRLAALKSLAVLHPYCRFYFHFRSFVISEEILRNQKIIIGLDLLFPMFNIFGLILDNTSLCIDYPQAVESCKIMVILFGSMLPDL